MVVVALLPPQFLQPLYDEHHVNRRPLGSKPTLFLVQNVLAFAIVTKATRDDFEECFAGVSQEGDTTIVATLRPMFLLVEHLSRCISPYCGTPPPFHTAAMTSWDFQGLSIYLSSAKTFRSSARRSSGLTGHRFASARI